ncbi:hypothetical protein FNF27_06270 [Cafeteria roenbergensis]|uniref:Uncharacterized protein n=1 Tax=Cafeteria roenbergensis TaxID=33653 RepID=A0A5A8E659_CAFRO|nr:hypothetical protein FNF27_06270 [Cafeteria roenbergensis]
MPTPAQEAAALAASRKWGRVTVRGKANVATALLATKVAFESVQAAAEAGIAVPAPEAVVDDLRPATHLNWLSSALRRGATNTSVPETLALERRSLADKLFALDPPMTTLTSVVGDWADIVQAANGAQWATFAMAQARARQAWPSSMLPRATAVLSSASLQVDQGCRLAGPSRLLVQTVDALIAGEVVAGARVEISDGGVGAPDIAPLVVDDFASAAERCNSATNAQRLDSYTIDKDKTDEPDPETLLRGGTAADLRSMNFSSGFLTVRVSKPALVVDFGGEATMTGIALAALGAGQAGALSSLEVQAAVNGGWEDVSLLSPGSEPNSLA